MVKSNGLVVLSAPDKDHTFDKTRALTPYSHLLEEYQQNVTEITDEHYLDFLRGVHPEVFQRSENEIAQCVQSVRNRREHAHVWDSRSFAEFITISFTLLGIRAKCEFLSTADTNKFEYFSVWRKL